MTLSGKARAELRGEAHHLQPLVQVGHQGVTPTLLQSLEDALRARELVKVQLSKQSELDIRVAARELADATGAQVVQVIGRTTTLYRHNPELPRRRDDPPPWKRV
jgi:RNA-binding protein